MRSWCVFDSLRLLRFPPLLSIFSPIVLSFLLAINSIFHDVVDKFLVHFLALLPSTTLSHNEASCRIVKTFVVAEYIKSTMTGKRNSRQARTG